jgi:hypothetical protein
MQPDATDRLTAFLKANGIGLIRGKHGANDFKAVFNTRMSGPPRRISDVLIARIFIKIFGIALTPWAQNDMFGLQYHSFHRLKLIFFDQE